MGLRWFADPDGVAWLAADDVITLLHQRADHAPDAPDVREALRRDADALYDATDTEQTQEPAA
jgi:hypothetical protein